MATRLYVTSRAPGTYLQGPPVGDWYAGDDGRANRGQRAGFIFRLAQTNVAGGVSLTTPLNTFTSSVPVDNQHILSYRWVTDPLGADVTISGTLQITVRVSIPDDTLGEDISGFCYAYVSTGDTLTQRAVLVNNVTDATNWTIANVWRTMTFTCTSADALAGDRIVVELGADCSPGTQISNTYSLLYGTTDTSQTPYSDATDGSGGTGAAWAEFSTSLTFAADPAAPANDACADAVVIAAVPYTSPVINTTVSADTDRAAWYTWTADRTGRMFVTTWGGNYSTAIRVYTGGCGALSFVIGSLGQYIAWQGTAQAVSTFEATEGVQYWIKVTSYYVTAGTNAYAGAFNSGGALRVMLFPYAAPAYGDLFVDCQHIVCYREGVPINVTPNWYELTPTGCWIDYTHRPLDDLNGGTNSGVRLYVALFGPDPLVEILDLETLNVTGSEIDFLLAPIDTAPHSENLSSVTLDVNGNLVCGYFGDNYSVQGGLSSAAACAITRIDATHADNQAGAPFAVADRFTITQENEGSDYIDVSADGSTAYYTSAGVKILRYNLDTTTQLADFGTIPAGANVRPGARGLKLFVPMDGTAGLVVPAGNVVYRLNGSGTVSQTYTPTDATIAQDLDKCDFSPDSTSFWVSDQYSTHIFKFNVSTGEQTLDVDTQLPPGQLSGFAVYGSRKLNPPPTSIETRTDPIRRVRQAPHLWDGANGHRLTYPGFQLLVESGAPRDTDIPLTFFLQWSDDGGHTWSNLHEIQGSPIGRYLYRFWWHRLGQSRDRVFRVVNSDDAKIVLVDALLTPDPREGAN